MTPRIEARQAAAWWASRLGNCVNDFGMGSVAEMEMTIGANLGPRGRFGAETVDLFQQHLEVGIEAMLAAAEARDPGSWRPSEPRRAAAFRTLRVDYHPCPVLAAAAEAAGIRLGRFDLPVKTWMKVNPGQLEVKEGYSGRPGFVWQKVPHDADRS